MTPRQPNGAEDRPQEAGHVERASAPPPLSPRDIKFHVNRFIERHRERFAGRDVVDAPAGTGIASAALAAAGARVTPLDLFPEFFRAPGLTCRQADLAGRLPLDDGAADVVLCQEGLEHLADQLHALREFNRVLRPGGVLLATTPNASNLKSRLSHLLFESEYSGKLMPPNEVDSIWMAREEARPELYFGHLFLIGVMRLRALARIAGFRLEALHPVRVNRTSALLWPLLYPLLAASALLTRRQACRRHPHPDRARLREVYAELVRLNLHPRVLLGTHLFVELRKECAADEAARRLTGKYADFDVVT